MTTVPKAIPAFLRILRLARDYFPQFPGRWISLLSLLSRKLKLLWRIVQRHGWLGTLQSHKPSEPAFFGTRTSTYSESGGSAVYKGYVIAASTVPESASHPNAQERAEQVAPAAPALDAVTVTANPHTHSHDAHEPNQPHTYDLLNPNQSTSNLSTRTSVASFQSRASHDRYLAITGSHESLGAAVGQPSSRPSRAAHHQFGLGPDPSRSKDRSKSPSRTQTPTNRPFTPHQLHRPDIGTTNQPYFAHGDGQASSVVLSSKSSHEHGPPSPRLDGNSVSKPSSISIVDIKLEHASTESLHSSTNHPQLTEEPSAKGPATAHSPPVASPVNQHDEISLRSSTASTANILPDGRFVQLIHSDQVPRYTKNITM
jgi:hypothetical protein